MNVLAIQSSGDQTSLCVIIKDDVIQYSIKHERKDRPNWSEMLSNLGLDSFFTFQEIDIFAYANNSGSYTATRSVAAYLKGIASALSKPLIVINSDDIEYIDSDVVAKKALDKYINSKDNTESFRPKNANPIYSSIPQYKKVNE
jgi:tRNA A37 threonylcarbamoyladenosine modification protein TsaB